MVEQVDRQVLETSSARNPLQRHSTDFLELNGQRSVLPSFFLRIGDILLIFLNLMVSGSLLEGVEVAGFASYCSRQAAVDIQSRSGWCIGGGRTGPPPPN